MEQTNVSLPTPKQSQTLQRLQTEIISRYGNAQSFANTFSVLQTQRFSRYPSRCVNGSAPTLWSTEAAYGKNFSTQWLATHLIGLSEYCGAKDKITPYQLQVLSNILRNEFGHLKVTEFMLFFNYLSSAKWGKIEWGKFDPIVITDMLRKSFLPLRAEYIERYEQEQREIAETEHRKRAIPRPGFLEDVYKKLNASELLHINK